MDTHIPKRSTCSCGKKAVIFRRYEGRYLCAQCFCTSIEKKVKRTIRQHHMIQPGDKIAVALSGGKDSTTVLHILHMIVKPRRDMELIAVSVNEGIRNYRKEGLQRAKRTCKECGITHVQYSFKKELGKTLDTKTKHVKGAGEACTHCGVGRRYILNKAARERGCTKLCVGHNLDDETQTVFMNYIRGDLVRASRVSAVTNASTKKKKGFLFVPRIKPLRDIPEKEVALYALLKGFDIGFDKCPNSSGIRFAIKDFLNGLEANYPGVKFSILETFDKIVGVSQRPTQFPEEIRVCSTCGEPSAQTICKTCELWG